MPKVVYRRRFYNENAISLLLITLGLRLLPIWFLPIILSNVLPLSTRSLSGTLSCSFLRSILLLRLRRASSRALGSPSLLPNIRLFLTFFRRLVLFLIILVFVCLLLMVLLLVTSCLLLRRALLCLILRARLVLVIAALRFVFFAYLGGLIAFILNFIR
jgi:hypothetical protein